MNRVCKKVLNTNYLKSADCTVCFLKITEAVLQFDWDEQLRSNSKIQGKNCFAIPLNGLLEAKAVTCKSSLCKRKRVLPKDKLLVLREFSFIFIMLVIKPSASHMLMFSKEFYF